MQPLCRNLLYLFYPRLCSLCGNPLTEAEQELCFHCFCELPRLDYHKRKTNPMFKLYAGIPQIHEVAAFLLYEKKGYTQSLIHSFKYKDCKKLATYLGRIASSYLKADNLFGETDLLVPVPLHPQKEKKRGYNQAEWIAKGVAAVYGKPVISDILYRKTASATQTKKSRYERHLNVETIFALHETKTFDHKHILLIDDVVTTGATSIACIEALTVVPGIKISILALSVVAIG